MGFPFVDYLLISYAAQAYFYLKSFWREIFKRSREEKLLFKVL